MLLNHVFMRRGAAMGLLGCLVLALLPVGCGGVDHAPTRLQYLTNGTQLPTMTEERVAGCIRTYSHQLERPSYQLQAKVRIEDEGRKTTVDVQGVPDSAPDFAACMRITLRDMAVPSSMLRTPPTSVSINAPTKAVRNELANPAVLWGAVALIFAELVVEVGGIEVVLAVSLEMVAVAADVLIAARKKKKKTCTELLQDCLETATNDLPGNHPGQRRCAACWLKCVDGTWPKKIDLPDGGSCAY